MALQIAKRGVGVATMLDQANLNCALTHLKMYATVTLIFIFLMRALHIASLRGLATVLGQVIFNWVFHSSQSVPFIFIGWMRALYIASLGGLSTMFENCVFDSSQNVRLIRPLLLASLGAWQQCLLRPFWIVSLINLKAYDTITLIFICVMRAMCIASHWGLATVLDEVILNLVFNSSQDIWYHNIDFHLLDESTSYSQPGGLDTSACSGYFKLCLWFISKCTLDKATAFSQPGGLTTVLARPFCIVSLIHLKAYDTITLIFICLIRALCIASLRGLTTVLAQAIFNCVFDSSQNVWHLPDEGTGYSQHRGLGNSPWWGNFKLSL